MVEWRKSFDQMWVSSEKSEDYEQHKSTKTYLLVLVMSVVARQCSDVLVPRRSFTSQAW